MMAALTEKHLEKIQSAGEQLLQTIDLTALANAIKILDPYVTCTADSLAKDLRNYIIDIMDELRQNPEVDPCKRRKHCGGSYLCFLHYYLVAADDERKDIDTIVEQSEWSLDIQVAAARLS